MKKAFNLCFGRSKHDAAQTTTTTTTTTTVEEDVNNDVMTKVTKKKKVPPTTTPPEEEKNHPPNKHAPIITTTTSSSFTTSTDHTTKPDTHSNKNNNFVDVPSTTTTTTNLEGLVKQKEEHVTSTDVKKTTTTTTTTTMTVSTGTLPGPGGTTASVASTAGGKRRTVYLKWTVGKHSEKHRYAGESSFFVRWVLVDGRRRDPNKQEIPPSKFEDDLQLLLQQPEQHKMPVPSTEASPSSSAAASAALAVIPESLENDLMNAATDAAAASAADPVSDVFTDNDLRRKIFLFLESKDLGRCRSVSMDWYCWGMETLDDPSHVKKEIPLPAFFGIFAYLNGIYRHDKRPLYRQLYDPTNEWHRRSFKAQCVYGKSWTGLDIAGFFQDP